MADSKDLEVVVRIVPGSTSARVMLDTLDYLKSPVTERSGEYEAHLIEWLQKSIQAMPTETGADMIQVERARQLFVKNFTPEHDDQFTGGDLIEAACAYGVSAEASYFSKNNVTFATITAGHPPTCWPWKKEAWKRSSTPIGDLVKAGALIAAEIDRLNRILKKEAKGGGLS